MLVGSTLGGWLYFLLKKENPFQALKNWWLRKSPLNWIWLVFTIALYALHNFLILTTYSFSSPELISIWIGRILTAAIVMGAFWLVAQTASLSAPKKFHLIPWVIPALLPGFLIVDALGIFFWKNPLRIMVNKIDEDGSVNLKTLFEAGGLEGIIGIGIVIIALCYLAYRLSVRIAPRIFLQPRFALMLIAGLWIAIAAEKWIGLHWKSRTSLQQEQNAYNIHLTPIRPSPGVATFDSVWLPATSPDLSYTTQKRPDIFVFLLESVRRDALSPAHAPFLCAFRDHECQPLGNTWAASNGTHLSWFSIFHGQIPPYWAPAIDTARKTNKLPPSPWIQYLDQHDYQIEARAVCDLDYNGMGSTNFGLPSAAHKTTYVDGKSEFGTLSIPNRELQILSEVKDSLVASTSQGNFHLIALDAPHYGYYWHENFDPPYSEYDESPVFHPYPNQNEIQRVKNRYLNAIAWTDHLIHDFVDFLKQQNRYQNSLIIITGDHGEEFQEHGSWFHCSSLEPEQTAVPILIKWPQGTSAPTQASSSHLDLLPSLLDYLDLPPVAYNALPGRSLLSNQQGEATQITITSYTGITGIAMTWHREGYTATFRWARPWTNELPNTLHLDDLKGPSGSLNLSNPQKWEMALKKHFPDAEAKLFSKFRLQN